MLRRQWKFPYFRLDPKTDFAVPVIHTTTFPAHLSLFEKRNATSEENEIVVSTKMIFEFVILSWKEEIYCGIWKENTFPSLKEA